MEVCLLVFLLVSVLEYVQAPGGCFGFKCRFQCRCKNDVACDQTNGRCPWGECAPGYWGPGCQLNDSHYYNNNRRLYEGNKHTTHKGRECAKWKVGVRDEQNQCTGIATPDDPNDPDIRTPYCGSVQHNFCRWLGPRWKKPWCYLSKSYLATAACDVTNAECPPGRYGDNNCDQECHCQDPAVTCSKCTLCADGWHTPPNCIGKCPYNYFGPNCVTQCHCDGGCGKCDGHCHNGWAGHNCHKYGASFGEKCDDRTNVCPGYLQCLKSANCARLGCQDSVCRCDESQYHDNNKCHARIAYLGQCTYTWDPVCVGNLECLNSVCQCLPTDDYVGGRCVLRTITTTTTIKPTEEPTTTKQTTQTTQTTQTYTIPQTTAGSDVVKDINTAVDRDVAGPTLQELLTQIPEIKDETKDLDGKQLRKLQQKLKTLQTQKNGTLSQHDIVYVTLEFVASEQSRHYRYSLSVLLVVFCTLSFLLIAGLCLWERRYEDPEPESEADSGDDLDDEPDLDVEVHVDKVEPNVVEDDADETADEEEAEPQPERVVYRPIKKVKQPRRKRKNKPELSQDANLLNNVMNYVLPGWFWSGSVTKSGVASPTSPIEDSERDPTVTIYDDNLHVIYQNGTKVTRDETLSNASSEDGK